MIVINKLRSICFGIFQCENSQCKHSALQPLQVDEKDAPNPLTLFEPAGAPAIRIDVTHTGGVVIRYSMTAAVVLTGFL